MASSAALFRTFPHSVQPKSPNSSMSALLISLPQAPKSHRLSTSIPALGVRLFSPWTGFKHFGLSFRQKYVKRERRKCGGRVVYASLFGVGAPEALVIGVVALLVFGPKGLAEVARNLGKTLRAFQPTIRELQEVSREFKSTLEREIGLDEVVATTKSTFDSTPSSQSQNPQAKVDPNGTPPTNSSTSSEEPLKASKEQPTAPVLGQQEEATASPKEQFTASVATQQEEATASPEGQLTASVTTQQAEAPATEQQPIVIATEQRAGPVPSSDEPPQATRETSVGGASIGEARQ